ncbi:MAG: HPr kinase/phosphatase C-terminal domain-containing protein, partial [Sphingomicrobium sp.]
MSRLSSEMVHATTVAKDGRAVVIAGRSGSGKSDLALRLIDRGFVLVSDDQTLISKANGKLIASAPTTIRGKIEVRGIGILEVDQADSAAVSLWIELGNEIKRLPDEEKHLILGIEVPKFSLDAMTASAPIKVELALGML